MVLKTVSGCTCCESHQCSIFLLSSIEVQLYFLLHLTVIPNMYHYSATSSWFQDVALLLCVAATATGTVPLLLQMKLSQKVQSGGLIWLLDILSCHSLLSHIISLCDGLGPNSDIHSDTPSLLSSSCCTWYSPENRGYYGIIRIYHQVAFSVSNEPFQLYFH